MRLTGALWVNRTDDDLGDMIGSVNNVPEVLWARSDVRLLIVIKPVLDRPHTAAIDIGDQLALGEVVHRLDAALKGFIDPRLEFGILMAPAVHGVAG